MIECEHNYETIHIDKRVERCTICGNIKLKKNDDKK